MEKNKTHYIYLNSKDFDGTVFVTQVADWLNLYRKNGIDFKYYHLFFYRKAFNREWIRQQINGIKTCLNQFNAWSYSFPSRGIFVYFNVILWYFLLKKEFKGCNRIVIFSRMMYGREIKVLRKWVNKPLVYIYDSRAASVEENKYKSVKTHQLSKARFNMFCHISYTECITVNEANKIFSVSNQLQKYLTINYGVPKNKFFIYPCLSDLNKFFYDVNLREHERALLGFEQSHRVYLYSGGFSNTYHILDGTIEFLNRIAASDNNARFILLSKDKLDENLLTEKYPDLVGRYINHSVPNNEVMRYLNAADYGLLFRENVPMNNVASPSKFAEYVLCGLPTLISEGIGDYSQLCIKENLGIMIPEEKFENMSLFDFDSLKSIKFNRTHIALYGKEHLSKQSQLPQIINQFKMV